VQELKMAEYLYEYKVKWYDWNPTFSPHEPWLGAFRFRFHTAKLTQQGQQCAERQSSSQTLAMVISVTQHHQNMQSFLDQRTVT
jgi:hypothetical protein